MPTTVQLGSENSWPPYSDKDGAGLSRALVESAYRLVGQPVVFTVMPYARLLRAVDTGQLDGGFNVTRQDSTEALFIFGQEPLLRAPASFFYPLASKRDYQRYADIPDGTHIALIIGYEYGDAFEKERHRFVEMRVSDQRQIIKLLASNRVDMAVMFDKVFAYKADQMDVSENVVRKGHNAFVSDIYVAFSRRNPEQSKQWAAMLDQGLLKLRQSGEYQRLMDSY